MVSKEYVVLVNEKDEQVGTEEKLKAHEQGLLHRAFSVFLFRNITGKIQVLLQKRARHKYHCPGLWANTCCSHPREGEDIVKAGKRRLFEEMGISVDYLKEVGSFQYRAVFENGLIEHEIDHVLIGRFDSDTIGYNKDEVEAVSWIAVEDLIKELEDNKESFTPWLRLALQVISKQEIKQLLV